MEETNSDSASAEPDGGPPSTSDVRGKRVVFHAINQIGLGHLSRLSAIAQALRSLAPEVSILFTVEGTSHGLLEAAALPYLSVSIPALAQGAGAFPAEERERLAQSYGDFVLNITRPDLLVFDSFPSAKLLIPAQERGIPLALCMRKLKDAQYRRLQRALPAFDVVICPHDAGEIDIPSEVASKTHFVGTIVRPLSDAAKGARADIVVSGGGGGYPGTVDFFNASLEAIAILRQTQPVLTALLVTGPLFGDWAKLRSVDGVLILPFDPDLTATFRSSRLAVCQAGYNTISEIAALGVPAVCVPAHRHADDQFERAARIARELPHVQVCTSLDAEALAAMMLRGLALPREPRVDSLLRGAELAAHHLLNALVKSARASTVR